MSAGTPKNYKIINSVTLIDEIKKRPLLYDFKRRPNTIEARKIMWDEVAQALFDEGWIKLSEDEKESLVKEIQVKWKSLRDNFTRILRKEKADELNGVNNPKKKKYIYFDQLMFLEPYCNSKVNPNVVYLDESQNSNDSNSLYEIEESNPIPPLQFIQIQPNSTMSVSAIQSTPSNTEDDNNTFNTRIANVLEELVSMQKEDKGDDPMGNRKFLLSLLPFMKKLPDDVNLEVRLQLMSVIQTYSNSKGFN